MKIERHDEIEVILALDLSLTETLAKLGLTHEASGVAYRKSIRENGREVYRGTTDDVWTWLRMGATWEDEQC